MQQVKSSASCMTNNTEYAFNFKTTRKLKELIFYCFITVGN